MTDNPFEREKRRLREYWNKENFLQNSQGYFQCVSSMMIEKKLNNHPLDDKIVLDVGCGLGKQLLWFRNRGAKVYGIDLSHEVGRIAQKKKLTVVTGDARTLPFKDSSFDIVYSLGVVEHFLETEKAIAEQIRVLRPGGIIIIVVPYIWTPYALALTLFQIVRGVFFKYGFLITRGKLFSKKQIKGILDKSGCENIQIEAYYGSAFLRMLPFQIKNDKLISKIEKSALSKKIGLVLYAQANKKLE